jgi:hypothetical protein
VEPLTFPQTDTVGTVAVTTWLDESKGTHSYRTEVSHVDAMARGGIWSAVADTEDSAAKNHASGLIQAAEVELDAWLRAPKTDGVPAAMIEAGRRLDMDARAVAALRAGGAHADDHRRNAARKLVELERE